VFLSVTRLDMGFFLLVRAFYSFSHADRLLPPLRSSWVAVSGFCPAPIPMSS
jgi:hypothetical protein